MLVVNLPGWTWEYVDEYMTLPRLAALTEHWTRTPPISEVVAAAVGARSKRPKGGRKAAAPAGGKKTAAGSIDEFMGALASAGFAIERKPKAGNG